MDITLSQLIIQFLIKNINKKHPVFDDTITVCYRCSFKNLCNLTIWSSQSPFSRLHAVNKKDGRANENAVNLFLSVQRAAPLPIIDIIGAVADGLPRHRAGLTAVEEIIQRRPVHRARLGLHHPEILPLKAASQVVGEAVVCGVYVPRADIVIPGSKGERLADDVVIEAIEKSHEVAGDELPRFGVLADRVDLILLVGSPGSGDESFPVEHQSGIMLAHGNRNFSPVVVGLTPVRGSPVRVQVVEIL